MTNQPVWCMLIDSVHEKPNRFSPLWIWLSLTSQRFHMRTCWSHFIHHSKAIHWVINPWAYLAAGDGSGTNTLEHTPQQKEMHTGTQENLHTHTHTFFWRGRHGDPGAEKPCDPTGTEDMLLDPSDQPQRKSLPPLSPPGKKRKRKKQKEGGEGRRRKNWIQLHSRNPLLALREWYQHHLKVWLLTKPITFWLLGNGPVD